MKDTFDLNKFLVENRITQASKLMHLGENKNRKQRRPLHEAKLVPADGVIGEAGTGSFDERGARKNFDKLLNHYKDPEKALKAINQIYKTEVPRGIFRDIISNWEINQGHRGSYNSSSVLHKPVYAVRGKRKGLFEAAGDFDEREVRKNFDRILQQVKDLDKAIKIIRNIYPGVPQKMFKDMVDNWKINQDQSYRRLNRVSNDSKRNFNSDHHSNFNTGASAEDINDREQDMYIRKNLEEAGYTDDFEDDDDLDIQGLPDIEYDPAAGAAAMRDMGGSDLDPEAPEDVETYDTADDEPEDDFEDPEDMDEPATPAKQGERLEINYDPQTVKWMDVDPEEMHEYLSQYRRPNVARVFLQRALNSAQKEADYNDQPIYLTLDTDGYYHTYRFRQTSKTVNMHVARILPHREED